ncbi:MAG: DnaB-like helicase C-terminal domain-containing protein [Fuerstiella sp.]
MTDLDRIRQATNGDHGPDQQRIAECGLELTALLLRKNADYGGSAWQASGAIVFHCSHDSCSQIKWQQFKQQVGVPLPEEFDPPLRQPAVPKVEPPKPAPAKKKALKQTQTLTTLKAATFNFADTMSEPQAQLLQLGIADLDNAMGGGIAPGEMVLLAARPSHGKSMVALQMVHKLTAAGVTCCFMSEEMSSVALGKRTALYATPSSEEDWKKNPEQFKQDLGVHFHQRAECHIMESSRTTERMCDNIRRLHNEEGVQCAIVDYAQLLQGRGGNRYEQVTNTSIALRHLATETGVSLIVLCQMSRAIEGRSSFVPQMGDLKDSGQLEQDADVLVYLVWPHRLDPHKPEDEYLMYVNKNRNREIRRGMISCRINPTRQRIDAAAASWESAANAFR